MPKLRTVPIAPPIKTRIIFSIEVIPIASRELCYSSVAKRERPEDCALAFITLCILEEFYKNSEKRSRRPGRLSTGRGSHTRNSNKMLGCEGESSPACARIAHSDADACAEGKHPTAGRSNGVRLQYGVRCRGQSSVERLPVSAGNCLSSDEKEERAWSDDAFHSATAN